MEGIVGGYEHSDPAATSIAGSAATVSDDILVSGASYFRLEADGIGGAFQVSSTNRKLRWRLMRLR